jgi:hypothetical protein
MNTGKLTTLFGFPIWKTRIAPELYNKQEIIDVINDNYRKMPYRDKWSPQAKALHHSFDDLDNPSMITPDFSKVQSQYADLITTFMNENRITGCCETNITNYTVINNEQYMHPHVHLSPKNDVAFAAVHYISFDPACHSPLVFHNSDPISLILQSSDFGSMVERDYTPFQYMNSTYTVEIEEDDFIIFPSCLKHSVDSSLVTLQNSKNRICIALNLKMRNTGRLDF